MYDITVTYEGSLCLVKPNTKEAREWMDENIAPDAQWWVGCLVVENRYIDNLLYGIEDAGFNVSAPA